MTFAGDPHWIIVRWHGRCAKCGATLHRGEGAYYYPITKKMYGEPCGDGYDAESDFQRTTQAEEIVSGRCSG